MGVEDENAGGDQCEGPCLLAPVKESGCLLNLEKREHAQSTYVGGQVDKTWQCMGYEGVEKKEEWKNKESPPQF